MKTIQTNKRTVTLKREQFKVKFMKEVDSGYKGEVVYYFKDIDTGEDFQWWTVAYKYFVHGDVLTFTADYFNVEGESITYLKNVRKIERVGEING